MKTPLRIAVLECDKPPPKAMQEIGGYTTYFTKLLKDGADAIGDDSIISSSDGFDITLWEVVHKQEYPNLDEIDSILITGSKYNSFDNDEWILKLVDFTQKALDHDRVRVLGSCFGHQIIARAMGAKVGRNNLGWETSITLVKNSERGEQLFGKDILSIQQMHQDIAYEHPEGVEALGSSPVCKVQGIYKKNKLLAVQGHPEFDETIMKEILELRYKAGIFEKEYFEDAWKRAEHSNDSVAIGRAFVQFLLDD